MSSATVVGAEHLAKWTIAGARWAFLFPIAVSWTLEVLQDGCSSVLAINIGICLCRILILNLTWLPSKAFTCLVFDAEFHPVLKNPLLGLCRDTKILKVKKSSAPPPSLAFRKQVFYLFHLWVLVYFSTYSCFEERQKKEQRCLPKG